MKKILFRFLIITFCLSSLSAQTFISKLNSENFGFHNSQKSIGNLKILAVMVEFQADKDESTFGDGTFGSIYSKDYGSKIIDPLPHDKQYFENHLEFAKNYFQKISSGKLNIDFTVFGQIIKVSKTIRDYSPPFNNKKDFTNLANFSKEVWTLASSKGIDFSEYDMFVIFHAGVGGDIQLPGSIGNEKDLPSVFLGISSLKKIYGDSFDGFEFSTGKINNTAILPCTESREIVSITGTNLLQLSINGLIAASIGSFIGLPDLYNTDTGISAVGRFALMDGQSIFNYGGLFPPEPSAWEKFYLGWIEPAYVDSERKVNLINPIVASISDTSYLRIPISNSEYFLLENRKRDANKDGCKITYKLGNSYYSLTFMNDIDGFNYYDVDSIRGVVVDVDEFDWALPGVDRDDESSVFQDVGFLVWHIDEKVIKNNLTTNSINNDKNIRGVRLVEADGIFDIGEKFTTIFGDEVIGDGTKEDTWYKSNPAHYYKNRFNDYSKPSAKSNSGANSLISISNISDVNNSMSFNLSFGNDAVKSISSFNFDKKVIWTKVIEKDSKFYFYLFTGDSVYKYDENSNLVFNNEFKTKFKPAIKQQSNSICFIGVFDNQISFLSDKIDSKIFKTWNDSVLYSTAALLDDNLQFYIGTNEGEIIKQSIDENSGYDKFLLQKTKVGNDSINKIAKVDDNLFALSGNNYWDSVNGSIDLKASARKFFIQNNSTVISAVILVNKNVFKIIENGRIESEFQADVDSIKDFNLVDLLFDGNNYIIFSSGDFINAYNINGVVAKNFPIKNISESSFYSNIIPLIKEDYSQAYILAFSEDGAANLINSNSAQNESPYPVMIMSNQELIPDVINFDNKTYMLVQESDLKIKFYQISDFTTLYQNNDDNNSIVSVASTINQIKEYFPQKSAYNYPNPVYDDVTYIRFYVSENSNVKVRIFDLAGNQVDELNSNASGGMENEIQWDVRKIQSGIYFANISAESKSGRSASKNIKIAVVK